MYLPLTFIHLRPPLLRVSWRPFANIPLPQFPWTYLLFGAPCRSKSNPLWCSQFLPCHSIALIGTPNDMLSVVAMFCSCHMDIWHYLFHNVIQSRRYCTSDRFHIPRLNFSSSRIVELVVWVTALYKHIMHASPFLSMNIYLELGDIWRLLNPTVLQYVH